MSNFKFKIFIYVASSVLLACLFSSTSYAQANSGLTIRGLITDGEKAPIPGVTIVEINANDRQVNGTVTGTDGRYVLAISSKTNRIRFSFIGFDSKVEAIGDRSIINTVLKETKAQQLQDVVIKGTVVQKVSTGFDNSSPRDIIGAVSSVTAETLAGQPTTSIDQMLQGQAAGVQVTSSSGDPGGGVDIRIRGAGSISAGNDPLYIIDGIPIISTPFDPSNAASSTARINPIADINPNDIERVDILKDANASAIYGAKGSKRCDHHHHQKRKSWRNQYHIKFSGKPAKWPSGNTGVKRSSI
jgi:hypothetical protein